jgi:hypothetical protein
VKRGLTSWQHGSDSGVYDKEGRFVPQMFEDMFSKWDVHGSGSLSAGELWNMIKGNRLVADPFGVSRVSPPVLSHDDGD